MPPHHAARAPIDFAITSSLHVAVIPDGNGRWATARGLPRTDGHRAGIDAVRRTVTAAPDLGISTLTMHAFSCDNWRRPAPEVRAILGCVGRFLDAETPTCRREGIRVTVIGRRDRLPPEVLQSIERAERATADGERLHLRLAVDYSSRREIVAAARDDARTREDFDAALGADLRRGPDGGRVPDVDLVVRSGGEMRLGDFLLWECAYAELVFLPTPWPEFGAEDLAAAVAEFHGRERRFGALPVATAAPGIGARGRS